jgi:hypothetical protein
MLGAITTGLENPAGTLKIGREEAEAGLLTPVNIVINKLAIALSSCATVRLGTGCATGCTTGCCACAKEAP